MTQRKTLSRKLRDWMLRRFPGMLTCKELDERTVDYVDGALPATTRWKFKLHLLLCAACRRYLRAYHLTMRLCAESVHDPDCPDQGEIPEALVDAIVSAGRSKSNRRK